MSTPHIHLRADKPAHVQSLTERVMREFSEYIQNEPLSDDKKRDAQALIGNFILHKGKQL